MEFTKDEINRFLGLIKSYYHDTAREFLYSDIGHIKTISITLKNSENKNLVYDTHIVIIYENATEIIHFNDDASAVFSDDDSEFLKSILDKKLEGLLLLYKNNLRTVYDEGGLKNEQITISKESFCGKLNIYINIRDRIYNMTRDDADLSDYLWGILCNNKTLMLDMLKYYMKDSECFSSNIQKRVQLYYDSLTDSEKLLFELGEDI